MLLHAIRRARHWAVLGAISCLGCADLVALPSLEPVYEGCATDENWMTLDSVGSQPVGEPQVAANTPIWLAPQPGVELDAGSPALLRFAASIGEQVPDRGDARCPQYEPQVLGLRHLPAVSGTLFEVRIERDGVPQFRLLTTRRIASLPPSLLSGLRGSEVRAVLQYVRLKSNQVVAGPYAAEPLPLRLR